MKRDISTSLAPQPFRNVPLAEAVIAWCPVHYSDRPNKGFIAVYPRDRDVPREITHTTGAVWAWWRKAKRDQRLANLMLEAWLRVVRDGLNPQDVQSALSVIPEFRESQGEEDFQPTNFHISP